MSERRAKQARRSKPSNGAQVKELSSAEAAEVAKAMGAPELAQETPPEQQPMTHPAVVVMRVPGEAPGQERIEIMELNGLDPLAVPTLLRVATRIKEESLGLSERK